jgi:hypothetical protein
MREARECLITAPTLIDRSAMLVSRASIGLALLLAPSLGCFGPKWGTASPDAGVLTIGPASFASDSGVTQAVLEKCDVQHELPEEIAKRSPIAVALAEDTSTGGRVLRLEVTNIFAAGGGRYSGPKQITLHGEIISGGQTTASFDVRRGTLRATRTCKMIDLVNKAISKDVKKWLGSPTQGAQLGELK